MKDKEKQIEEMAKVNQEKCSFCDTCDNCKYQWHEDCEKIKYASNIYNAGYRNCKDKVVLSREEYEKVKHVLKYEPEEVIIRLEDLTKNERLYSPHMFCSLGGCSGVRKGCNRTCKESWIVIERKETAEKIIHDLDIKVSNYAMVLDLPELPEKLRFIPTEVMVHFIKTLKEQFGVEAME